MYAILRTFEYDRAKLADAGRTLAQIRRLHTDQAGYAGSLVVDDGRRLIAVNLWDTEDSAAAGRVAIGEEVQRLLEPLMAGPSEVIAAGRVLESDREEHS